MFIYLFTGLMPSDSVLKDRALFTEKVKRYGTVKHFNWNDTPNLESPCLLIGHSFGGAQCLKLADSSQKVAVMTLDPVPQDFASRWLSNQFESNGNVIVNFLRTSRWYPRSKKVSNTTNIEINCGHDDFYRHPTVVSGLLERVDVLAEKWR